MRHIAVMKICSPKEKEQILSCARPDDRVLFFENKQQLLSHPAAAEIQIVLGEPSLATIEALPRLRWIQMTWAGANKYTAHQDFPRHITVTNASGAFGGVISEHILAGILALYKNLRAYDRQMGQGGWALLSGDDSLEGKSALILGTGNIGTETAKKLRAFGCKTIGIRRTAAPAPEGFDRCCSLAQLDAELPKADLVIIALPGTDATRGLINRQRLGKMKSSALLINVGRGFIADTAALTDALQAGVIRGAVLDVTDPEPLSTEHPLRHMDNVILTPHVSGVSWGENTNTRQKILSIFCDNLLRDASGAPLRNIIDFKHGY